MPLQCNIDAKGKLVRLIYGGVLLVAGIVMMFIWAIYGSGGALAWIVSIATTVGGAFAVFESRAGWCIVRAVGFKTPF